MKTLAWLLAVTATANVVAGASIQHERSPSASASAAEDIVREGAILSFLLERKLKDALGLRARGTPLSTAPSGNYAPTNSSQCPQTLIRNGAAGSNGGSQGATGAVSPSEAAWVSARRQQAVDAWNKYLSNSALQLGNGFNASRFTSNTSNLPNVAIAASGGGYRAMLFAAGVVNGFDSRNDSAVAQGTGGILQLSTYLSGLSGGSWFVGSLAANDFPTVGQLRQIWNLTENLVQPGGVVDLIRYYTTLHDEVSQKEDAGFDVSLTDYWGRALSRHLLNNSNNGLSTTFSSVQNLSSFSGHATPFPIIISNGRAPGEKIIPTNTTIWEFNPFEFGSRNPGLSAYTPMQFLGTYATNATANGSQCTQGFDNMGFVMGTSATLFNQIILQLGSSNSSIANILGDIIQGVIGDDNDIAPYPNTFRGLNASSFPSTDLVDLDLVDGGEDLENIPLWPLLHPERNVDVILALDASADTDTTWPNATSLVATRERTQNASFGALAPFPNVPSDQNTVVNRGLNDHATFFGCNESVDTPLLVYIPNHPYTSYANFTTFTLEYTDEQVDDFLTNGLHVAAQNSTPIADNVPTFPTCLACALVSRAERRAGTAQTDACQRCFSAYCWDGTANSTTPSSVYAPSIPGVNASSQVGGAGVAGGNPPEAGGAVLGTQAGLAGVAFGLGVFAVASLAV